MIPIGESSQLRIDWFYRVGPMSIISRDKITSIPTTLNTQVSVPLVSPIGRAKQPRHLGGTRAITVISCEQPRPSI